MSRTIYAFVRRLGQEHLAISGEPVAICGMPLLSINYAKYIEEEDRTKCSLCESQRIETERTLRRERMGRFNPTPMHGITEEEIVSIRSTINRTWCNVSGDLFRTDTGEPDYKLTFDREEMVEIALDAGRWEHYTDDEGKIAINKLKKLGWMSDEFKEVINQACPDHTYGY